jgi:hypothetical protein
MQSPSKFKSHSSQKKKYQIRMDTQKTRNSQSNPEQTEQCWMCHNIQFQVILQSHSDKQQQKIMALAQK